jgi:hypothetical protein
VKPRDSRDQYRPLENGCDLNEIFCLKEHRQVRMDHTISLQSELWKLQPSDSFSIARRDVEIRTYLDLTWKIFFQGKELKHEKFAKPTRMAS